MPTADYDKLFSVNQVAAICGVNRVTVKNWIRSGKIKVLHVGPKLIRITQTELTRFLTAQ